VQTPGNGYRLRSSVMLDELQQNPKLRQMVDNFLYVQMVTATQSVLCARLHGLQQRLSRWLLTAADRSESEQLLLTQEYMARMLGSRRSTVTVTAQALQEAGMIEYRRGRVNILDRPKFEAAACECYRIVKDSHDRLMPKVVDVQNALDGGLGGAIGGDDEGGDFVLLHEGEGVGGEGFGRDGKGLWIHHFRGGFVEGVGAVAFEEAAEVTVREDAEQLIP